VLAVVLLVTALALSALLVTARRAREAAQQAIIAVSATRRELRPALVVARDDTRRAATIRLPRQ
jgi:hypothetical protein